MIPLKNDPLKPAVITRNISIQIGRNCNNILIKQQIKSFLADLTSKLKNRGCRLIGHIKGMVEAPESGQALFFSLTDFMQEPCFKGSFTEGGEEARLLINVIVYGIETTEAAKAVDVCLSRHQL